MVGKRPRQMQRTVSVSMMHMRPESILSETPMIPEFPKEMQNPQVDVLACYSQGKSAVSTNNPDTDLTHLFVSNANSEACYAAHVFPFASEANHSRPRPLEIKEGEPDGGLSIVASLDGRDPYTTTFLTDSTDEIPAVYHNSLPHHFWTSLAATTLQQHQEMDLQELFCDHLTTVSGFLKGAVPNVSSEAHFLEVCCYCRHKLSHGRDIYMYRGDKAFCSEECRHQQIVIDEHQIKCSLTALKVRTVAQPAHLGAQQTQAIATSATAAG